MFIVKFSILFIIGVAYFFGYSNQESVVIKTPFGYVRGFTGMSRNGRKAWIFNGIPFAYPPIGKLRFQPPQLIEPWEGVFDAKNLGSPCVQYDNLLKRHLGSENCLFLNIAVSGGATDVFSRSRKLPVIIFIHGGSFLYGSSHFYNPQYFMDEELILITIHYRLGILGFLNTEDDVIRGNNGLKDQVVALKWIQKAISSFGGDTSRITVMGESAGAACAHLLMISNQTKGLFQRVITQSGSALSPWAFVKHPKNQAFRVGEILNCKSANSKQLLTCLQTVDAFEFADFFRREKEFWSEKFGPSVETPQTEENRRTAFLLESPIEISKTGNYHKVPWMTGVVKNEGCILAHAVISNLNEINKDWDKICNIIDVYNSFGLAKVRQEYFGNIKSKFYPEDLEVFSRMAADRQFLTGLKQAMLDHIQTNSSSPFYLYLMDYEGVGIGTEVGMGHFLRAPQLPFLPTEFSLAVELFKIRIFDFFGIKTPNYGICHADDLQFLFYQNPLLAITPGSQNYEFSKRFVSTWVEFASTGYETCCG